jgi:integrase
VPLTVKEIINAKVTGKPYKLADAGGLYLYVTAAGGKSWRCNYSKLGKQATKTFGVFPSVSLADARMALASWRDDVDAHSKVLTFAQVAAMYFKVKLPRLSNSKHQIQFATSLEKFVYPAIGNDPIDDIPRTKLVAIMHQMEALGIMETAYRVASRIGMVFDHAVDVGIIQSHGAAQLTRVLGPRKAVVAMATIAPTAAEAAVLLRTIDGYEVGVLRLALLLLAHTFVRPGELVGWRKDEIKYDDAVWVVPAERMKGRPGKRKPHVVPLSRQVLALLLELEAFNAGSDYVLPSPVVQGKHINDGSLLQVLYSMGYRGKMTAHGFRSLASTVMNEQSHFLRDVIERQLAHKETDDVRAAYNRAEYLPMRRELMQWWSDWLDAAVSSLPPPKPYAHPPPPAAVPAAA